MLEYTRLRNSSLLHDYPTGVFESGQDAPAASPSAVEHGLDVVPVGIEHEGAVVALAVVRPRAGRRVFAPAGGQRSGMEGLHLLDRVGREGDVDRGADAVVGRDREVHLLGAAELDL